MAGAHSCTGVAVKVLVKQDQVTPVRIGLELLKIPVYRPATSLIL